ncbi:MAG: hypothetical protein U1C53_02320 [Candidatus Veblenbacteria bacterium]|nr:hypothetical protein [Candidatus Veblenbacteria bacterium]MDZ4229950.1 hypothetical protein [Candidatus Veblenbacteria bacterium]
MDNTATKVNKLVERLQNSGFVEHLSNFINFLAVQDDVERGAQLRKILVEALIQRSEISSTDPKLWLRYGGLKYRLDALLLPILSDSEILDFFSHGIARVLSDINIELVDKVQARLLGIILHEERDRHKGELRQSLMENNETLVEVNIEGKNLRTCSDWVKDYSSVVGLGEIDPLKKQQYLSQNPTLRGLVPEQREILRRLFNLFDYLKLSSITPEGLEEKVTFIESGKKLILDKGEVREIPREASPILERILAMKREQIGGAIKQNVTSPSGTDINNQISAQPAETGMASVAKEQKLALPVINSSQFIHSTPQAFKSDKPTLVFDLEDEQEADKYRSKGKSTEEVVVFEKQIRTFVDEVIKANNLAFKDEVNRRRFEQLFVSRLKDVRGVVELREALRKPTEAGGLGLPEDKVEQVQNIVEAAKKEFELRIKNNKLVTSSLPTGQAGLPLATAESLVEEPKPSVPVTRDQEPAPGFDVEAAKAWREQMLRELSAQSQPVAASESAQPQAAPRPQLTDVKAPPKVVGPLEELRGLTLVDFRRLGATPTEALQKVRAKIDLLGETSIGRRLEAVRAWKSSVVYQQYLRLGRESIEQSKPISTIAGNYQSLGEQGLTEEEFSAIADFNARLRF